MAQSRKHEAYWRLALLAALGLATALPFFWMLGASFKTRPEAETPALLPTEPTAQNYPVVLDAAPDPVTGKFLGLRFGRWYFNTAFVAFATTALQVFTSALAAYAFSRIRWRGRDTVFLLYLATLMVPGVVTMIPNFQIMAALGMLNTYHGLILPAAFTAFGTFLLRQFMLSIPKALDEAASIDGAGHWRIFWDVALPLARPGLVALAIVTFLGNFQSFFWPLVMLYREDYYPLSIGLLSLDGQYGRQTELIMAATVMNVIPLIAIFAAFQKFLVKGIMLGGVKG